MWEALGWPLEPSYSREEWGRVLLSASDPVALNFWQASEQLGSLVKMQVPGTHGMPTQAGCSKGPGK